MGLFSKIKDYNVELEEILDNKYFSANIKSLLLSMIYKLEVSYTDFKEVKRCVRTKEDFLNEIIETIRLYCDNIKIVEPDSDQAKLLIKNNVKALTNEKERSILSYPTEVALLYAISEISPKYFYINQDFPLKKQMQSILVNGYNQNNLEILNDFNGWSWDKTFEKRYNYIENLIYQNMLIIFGEKFLYEWRTYGSTRRDFLKEAENFIKIFTGNYDYIKSLYKLIYVNLSKREKEKINLELKANIKKLRKMTDKNKFIQEQKNKIEKYSKKIKRYETVLNDYNLLEKEYIKINSNLDEKKRIKNIKTYKKLLENEKVKLFKEIDKLKFLLIPENFQKYKEQLKISYELYICKKDSNEILIENQKMFLNFLDKKLNKINTRDEIIDIIYELRYYKLLKISKDITISEIEEVDEQIDKILKKAITKLCKLGALKIVSMDINLNYEIIKYALDTKIIELEEIRLEFDIDENGLIIKIFDKDAIEKQGRKKIKLNKKTLEVKKKRRIKLFN